MRGAGRRGVSAIGLPAVANDVAGRSHIQRLLLVVEDNPGDARLLKEMFEDADPGTTELTQVRSMAIAEQHLAEHQVDAVLLD